MKALAQVVELICNHLSRGDIQPLNVWICSHFTKRWNWTLYVNNYPSCIKKPRRTPKNCHKIVHYLRRFWLEFITPLLPTTYFHVKIVFHLENHSSAFLLLLARVELHSFEPPNPCYDGDFTINSQFFFCVFLCKFEHKSHMFICV